MILQVLWLALPVVVAGVVHMVIVKKGVLAALAVPLDGGRTFRGERIFGPNKTWRGVVVMIAASAAAGALQGAIAGDWASGVECVDFAAIGGGSAVVGYALVNAALGLGYAAGELPNSFLKRQLKIGAGQHGDGVLGRIFFAVDQVDSVFVGLGLGAVLFGYPWQLVAIGTVLLAVVHLVITAALHRARLKENL